MRTAQRSGAVAALCGVIALGSKGEEAPLHGEEGLGGGEARARHDEPVDCARACGERSGVQRVAQRAPSNADAFGPASGAQAVLGSGSSRLMRCRTRSRRASASYGRLKLL